MNSNDLKFLGIMLLVSYFAIALFLSATTIRQRSEILDLKEQVQTEKNKNERLTKSLNGSLELLSAELKRR